MPIKPEKLTAEEREAIEYNHRIAPNDWLLGAPQNFTEEGAQDRAALLGHIAYLEQRLAAIEKMAAEQRAMPAGDWTVSGTQALHALILDNKVPM